MPKTSLQHLQLGNSETRPLGSDASVLGIAVRTGPVTWPEDHTLSLQVSLMLSGVRTVTAPNEPQASIAAALKYILASSWTAEIQVWLPSRELQDLIYNSGFGYSGLGWGYSGLGWGPSIWESVLYDTELNKCVSCGKSVSLLGGEIILFQF